MIIESADRGRLGVHHLRRLWSKALAVARGDASPVDFEAEWRLDVAVMDALGLPLEETIGHLYQTQPTVETFEDWVLARNEGALDRYAVALVNRCFGDRDGERLIEAEQARLDREDPVLSVDDLRFWNDNGYLVIPGAIDPASCRETVAAIWEHLDMDPDVPDTWYRDRRYAGIMVQLFHHPATRSNRRSRRIRKAFSQIWSSAGLLATVDRAGMNPPERPDWIFPGPHLHLDCNLEGPIGFWVQGLIYLTDTAPEQGAFACVPGFHKQVEAWIAEQSEELDKVQERLRSLTSVPIPGRAGDMVIWHTGLPHGSGPNRADHPRLVQYLTLYPAPTAAGSPA